MATTWPCPARPAASACASAVQFDLPPHKAGQPPRHGRLQALTDGPRADQLEHLHRLRQPLHRDRSERVDLHQALDQPQGRGRQQDAPGVASCSMRAARCTVCPMAE